MDAMKVLPVKGSNFVDVFVGEGFEGWSRYRRVMHKITKKIIYVHFKGNKLNTYQLKDLYSKVK